LDRDNLHRIIGRRRAAPFGLDLHQPGHETGRAPRFIGLRRAIKPWEQALIMIGGDGGDNRIDHCLVSDFTAIHELQSRIGTGQKQMVKPACQPQRHSILKRQARPMGNPPPNGSVGRHEGYLRIDDPSGHRRAIAAAMFGLHPYALLDASIIHYASAEIVRHIALSSTCP
jgi:hypothetical protein